MSRSEMYLALAQASAAAMAQVGESLSELEDFQIRGESEDDIQTFHPTDTDLERAETIADRLHSLLDVVDTDSTVLILAASRLLALVSANALIDPIVNDQRDDILALMFVASTLTASNIADEEYSEEELEDEEEEEEDDAEESSDEDIGDPRTPRLKARKPLFPMPFESFEDLRDAEDLLAGVRDDISGSFEEDDADPDKDTIAHVYEAEALTESPEAAPARIAEEGDGIFPPAVIKHEVLPPEVNLTPNPTGTEPESDTDTVLESDTDDETDGNPFIGNKHGD